MLRKIWREQAFKDFAAENSPLKGVDLIDKGFKHLNISLSASIEDLEKFLKLV